MALVARVIRKWPNAFVGEKEGWEKLLYQGIRDALNNRALIVGAYWLAIFGEPSDDTSRQWQVEGHHLVINMTMVDEHIPDPNHVHSVYRRPGGDFGDDIDILREHYLNDPAHTNQGSTPVFFYLHKG